MGEGEVYLERMTWPEIEAAIAGGKRRAIICAASSEQHGPHLPEATDALLGEHLAGRLARELGDALVAPVIRPGCSDHHMGFAGTITIGPALLMDLLDAYVDSLRRHGFTSFAVFSSHGGNFPVLAEWERTRPKPGAVVVSDLNGFCAAMFGAIRDFGRDDTTIPHADVMETAEMLAFEPELVRMERAEPGFQGEVTLARLQQVGMRGISPNGILGDPVGATAEMGEAVAGALVAWLADQLRASSVR